METISDVLNQIQRTKLGVGTPVTLDEIEEALESHADNDDLACGECKQISSLPFCEQLDDDRGAVYALMAAMWPADIRVAKAIEALRYISGDRE